MGKGDLAHSSTPQGSVGKGSPLDMYPHVVDGGGVRSRHQSSGGGSGVGLAMGAVPSLVSPGVKHREHRYSYSNGLVSSDARSLLDDQKAYGGAGERTVPLEGVDTAGEKKIHRESRKGSRCRGNVVLAILLLANLINYMDRYTIAGVLDDVKQFYGIRNAEAGLLQTSFIVSYMLLSPLFGYLGDRYNRKYIMAAGIAFWSIITLAGSFVGKENFWLFMLLRALVGVGEASYSTIAPTIIADMFVKTMRTKALSIFYFAIPVGSGLGYIVGSKVAVLMGEWQWALRVTPALGVVCTVLVLLVVVDPPRGASEGISHHTDSSWMSDIAYLFKHKSFMLSSLGFTCVAFVAGALALWAPLYMHRSMRMQQSDMSMATVSQIFGVITCVAGFSGVAIGSYAASLLRPYTKRADPLVCAFGLIASAPFLFLAICLSQHSIIATWVMIFFGEMFLSLNWALVTDILLYIVIPTRRSMAEAVQILLSHAFGDAGSPYVVGLVSDAIEASYLPRSDIVVEFISLQYALYLACFVCVLGGGFFLATALYVQRDRDKADLCIKAAGIQALNALTINDDGAGSAESSSLTSDEVVGERGAVQGVTKHGGKTLPGHNTATTNSSATMTTLAQSAESGSIESTTEDMTCSAESEGLTSESVIT